MAFCRPISKETLSEDVLKKDRKSCLKIARMGLGEKALYVNSYFLDRDLYIPYGSIKRVYKRVAMSKGGFTGQGVFASLAYLVIEYEDKEIQVKVKREPYVDRVLAEMEKRFPHIPLRSKKAEERLEAARVEEENRYKKDLSDLAKAAIAELEEVERRLQKKRELCDTLAKTAKTKRMASGTKPYYRPIKYVMLFGSLAAIGLGVYANRVGWGMDAAFVFFSFAAICIFIASQINRTGMYNKEAADREFEEAVKKMEESSKGIFPKEPFLPAYYCHPSTLKRMIRLIREGKAETPEEALEALKEDLKQMTSDVSVAEQDYEEIITIKPMFLCMDYK